jgi:hypothetical protein
MTPALVAALTTGIVAVVTAVTTGIALIVHARNNNAHSGGTPPAP